MAIENLVTSYGLDIYIERIPGMKNVDAELVVKVGSVNEPDELASICHALEHCTFLRTPSFIGTPAIDHFADRHAFLRNADTYYTRTNYYAKGLQIEPMFQLLGELVFNAEFRDDEVAAEMKSVRREAATRLDDVYGMTTLFQDYVLFGHPYGRDVVGYHDKLAFSAATLTEFYKTHYVPQNMALIVVGDVPSEKVRSLAEKFAVTPNASELKSPDLPVPTRPHPDISRYGYLREDSSNAYICLEAAAPLAFMERFWADEWAYSAAIDVLTQEIFETLRHKKGLSYNGKFGLWRYNHKQARRLRAEVTTDPDKVDQAFAALRSVLARDPESFETERFEEALISQSMLAATDVDDTLGRADMYVDMIAYGSPLASVEDFYEKAKQTTLDDVRSAFKDVYETWHAADILECVSGPKQAVGDRFVIEQSLFA